MQQFLLSYERGREREREMGINPGINSGYPFEEAQFTLGACCKFVPQSNGSDANQRKFNSQHSNIHSSVTFRNAFLNMYWNVFVIVRLKGLESPMKERQRQL